MSTRKLTVLGSSAQVPTKERNHSGYYLSWDKKGFLFDPGEGTQRQMTRFGIKSTSITHLFISHFHGDHCLGLPGVLQRMMMDGVEHSPEIYFPKSGQVFLENLIRASFYSGSMNLSLNPLENEQHSFESDTFVIKSVKLSHTLDCYGFQVVERDGFTLLPDKIRARGVIGNLIGQLVKNGEITLDDKKVSLSEVSIPRRGQKFGFITDTRFCKQAIELAQDSDLLLCESTYLSDLETLADTYGHLTASQAATIAKQAGVKKLVLSHFSQRYLDQHVMEHEASNIFPNCFAARDGDSFDFPKRRKT